MPEDHKLVAIMFTDIVGYTKLMGADESKALDLLARNRTIHETHIKQFNGTLIKDIGDAILASFLLASDAVRCAVEIQKSCKEDSIPLKIGIHEGEVVFKVSDVFGDGVNIASRLQSDAHQGCINISGSVYQDIKNKSDIRTGFIGEKTFKNVDEPIKVYKILCEGEDGDQQLPAKRSNKKPYFLLAGLIVLVIAVLLVWKSMPSKKAPELEKSIAVLPFKNLSNNPDDVSLADGMMEAILNHLQRIEDLSVRSRTSTEQYRDPDRNVSDIGKELSANYILEGSFQKIGNKANLTVQLIIAETDEHIWAEYYNRDWSDVFNVQKEIAERIASELYIKISSTALHGLDNIPTNNMEAYDLYLKGDQAHRDFFENRNLDKIYESMIYFQNSVKEDENFSLGYAGLGRAYWMLAHFETNVSDDMWINSKKNLKRAIEIDPYNGWAYAELGVVQSNWDWDSIAARKSFDIAIKLTPNNWDAYYNYFWHENRLGNCKKMKHLREGMTRINPEVYDDQFHMVNLITLLCEGKYHEITEIADKYWSSNMDIEKSYPVFYSYRETRMFDKAETVIDYFKSSNELKFEYQVLNAELYATKGDREMALDIIDSFDLTPNQGRILNSDIASIYATLGDSENMYKYLEKGLEKREAFFHNIIIIPSFEPYFNEPRFQEIIQKMWIPRHIK